TIPILLCSRLACSKSSMDLCTFCCTYSPFARSCGRRLGAIDLWKELPSMDRREPVRLKRQLQPGWKPSVVTLHIPYGPGPNSTHSPTIDVVSLPAGGDQLKVAPMGSGPVEVS